MIKLRKVNIYLRRLFLVLVACASLFQSIQTTVYAQVTGSDISSLRNSRPWYDPEDQGQCRPSDGGDGITVPIDGENPKRAFEYLRDQGLSDEQAAGVVGNLMVESGESIDPLASNNGNYLGIAQWDASGRYASLKQWAEDNAKDHT